MVFGAIIAGAIALTPTIMNIGQKTAKFYGKTGSFGKASSFGLGYGAFTAVGFNLVPQFGRTRRTYNRNTGIVTLDTTMPYARYNSRYPRRRYSTYSRYSRYTQRRPYRSYRARPRYYRRY